ncbi:MAG: hypothetical protein JEZ12_10115 [Desulfobacterium sp.]|nr:hypothetical protein [Desulfobacterium sp.]
MDIYCIRNSKRLSNESECRCCNHRRRCRAFQLWLQPELPFVFKPNGRPDSVFDAQNDMKDALDALFPREYALLKKRALNLLPGSKDSARAIVRLKMYELLHP